MTTGLRGGQRGDCRRVGELAAVGEEEGSGESGPTEVGVSAGASKALSRSWVSFSFPRLPTVGRVLKREVT